VFFTRKENEQNYLTIGCESGSTQVDKLPEGGKLNVAPADGGVTVEKNANMAVKNPVSGFEELVTESDHAIQTSSEFSNFKTVSIDCLPDNSMISFGLIKVAVMDEDIVILNRDLMGKQSEKISPPVFEESSISPSIFMVGCG